VHHRIKELQRSFRLRLLICHIDVEDVVEPLAQVIKAALLNEVTLICGWSPEVWVESKHVTNRRMSTLREGHASLLCIVLIATDVIEVTIIGELGRGLLDG